MDDNRLKQSLQQIIFILQKSDGKIEYSRLAKRLIVRGRDDFYSIEELLDKLKEMELIENVNGAIIKLTMLGKDFKSFSELNYQKYKELKVENLNIENLELENQNLKIQNSTKDRQIEIDKLTIENLRLQNKQMKRHIIYSVISFTTGAIVTNVKDIITFVSNLLK